ncbi:MAG: leucyl aminopeptidase [Nitriliruptoraceae bacterium]
MQIDAIQTSLTEADAALVVIAAVTRDSVAVAVGEPGDLGLDLAAAFASVGFTGANGTTARLPLANGGSLLAIGLGAEVSTSKVRSFGAAAARIAKDVASAAVLLPPVDGVGADVVSGALAEGFVLGSYAFTAHRSEVEEVAVVVVTVHGGADAAALRAGQITGEAVALTRDLVNTPPNFKRPPALAARAVELVAGTGITSTIIDDVELRERGYGGMTAVGQGSAEGPRIVELVWNPEGASGDHIALVGKGITFDTGGISLKPSASMETMKMDMGGAATVLSVILAAARLKLPVKVSAILCLAENMPSGTAQRVSDVYTALDGTTVEVLNTDAEGRLVLADGITHAGRMGADVIVDVATLTGAAVVALGEKYSVLMSNDDALADALLIAGSDADELMWRMPLAAEQYNDKLDSDVADIKNVGGRAAGTIVAGLFLHRFVPAETRWAHLDIAGSAWTDSADGILSKGATGVPVRALVAWLSAR